ncbi:MAG: helicase-related protein, partial [Waterburya sp.]
AYHAGLATDARRNIEASWISGKIQFVICTSAFGMGIEKPNVRFVVHYHAPELLAEYVQEVGRAGRDGKSAQALTLISEPTGFLDPQAQQEIIQTLELDQPATFLLSPYRQNLSLRINTVWTPRGRKQQMLKFIQAHQRQSGLVYVRSRQESQTLATWFKSLGYAVTAYHAGLATDARRNIEASWISGKIQFVICTSAFGMGIDKPNVRFVVHYHAPELLAEYIQEVGRAGRDGKSAQALTLISEPTGFLDPQDRQRSKFFTDKLTQQYRQAQKLVPQIPNQGNIATIKEQFAEGEITLGILHSLGLVVWSDPFNYRKQSSPITVDGLARSQKVHQTRMQAYLQTKHCRWQYLLQAFGFSQSAQGFTCGSCDNCQK